ncbi:MAG: DegT/DnrJ/EryC1/StrS aminotransferase family protein [Symploca sp. SIO1B1]|nr:DegT/DnrJ/EryC1/StrS aminotransferase family protein [Symploca sp. SIO1B1]
MIPRFKPTLGWQELKSILLPSQADNIEQFEQAFAQAMGQKDAVAFPYGRSALWTFLKALDIKEAEIIVPAYTCVVVAHAIVLSHNIPKFVDIDLENFNLNLDLLEAAITPKTKVVVATHLFGFPLDVQTLKQIVLKAEQRFGNKIWIIQDCAHSFRATHQGKLVTQVGDASLFGLNVAKYITSLSGGMLSFSDLSLADKVRQYRDQTFIPSTLTSLCLRRSYFLANLFAFSNWGYPLIHWLINNTAFIDSFVKYYDESIINLPKDFQRFLMPVEASLGQLQLEKLSNFEFRRREIAQKYYRALRDINHLIIPPYNNNATYSHFVALLAPGIEREQYITNFAKAGIEIGYKLEYCLPVMKSYAQRYHSAPCPNALEASRRIINLPIAPSLRDSQIEKVIQVIQNYELSQYRVPTSSNNRVTMQ